MERRVVKDGDYARIRGRNFQGQIQFSADSLKLSLTQFEKGALYSIEINDGVLHKDFRRYIFFKKAEDLFEELMDNYKMEISDQQSLILPIEISFKGRPFQLKIQIPLQVKKYSNESEKLPDLYEHIAKMNRFYMKLEKQKLFQKKSINIKQMQNQTTNFVNSTTSQLIVFKGDQKNSSYKFFEACINKIKLPAASHGNAYIYNHQQALPKIGVFHFKFKINHSSRGSAVVIVGICGKNIKQFSNDTAIKSPYFMGYNLNKAQYLANKIATPGGAVLVYEKTSLFKVQINLTLKHLVWYLDDSPFYLAKIPKDLDDVYLYPFVMLNHANDQIQFVLH